MLQRHNHFNGLKTVLLFGGIWGVLLLVGAAVAAYFRSPGMILVFALIAVGTTAYGYWNSDKLAIRAMRAVPVTEAEQPAMYRIVRELSAVAQQPVPRLYVSPDHGPERLRDRARTRRTRPSAARSASSSCSTSASCAACSATSSCTSTTATSSPAPSRRPWPGVITSVAQFLQLSFLFGGNRGNNGNPLAIVGVLASAVLAPFAATLIQLAISRTREFDADEDGSALTGDPLALASALRKLEHGTQRAPLPPERQLVNASHLFIANPFRGGGAAEPVRDPPPDAAADRAAGAAGVRLAPVRRGAPPRSPLALPVAAGPAGRAGRLHRRGPRPRPSPRSRRGPRPTSRRSPCPPTPRRSPLERVVDGDTLARLRASRARCCPRRGSTGSGCCSSTPRRSTGRTPRRSAWGPRRRRSPTDLLPEGSTLLLAPDEEAVDQYDRLLAYAWTPDGVFVNEAVVANGFAYTVMYPPNDEHVDVVADAEQRARDARLGVWGSC